MHSLIHYKGNTRIHASQINVADRNGKGQNIKNRDVIKLFGIEFVHLKRICTAFY